MVPLLLGGGLAFGLLRKVVRVRRRELPSAAAA
jgi:hypothetical protein